TPCRRRGGGNACLRTDFGSPRQPRRKKAPDPCPCPLRHLSVRTGTPLGRATSSADPRRRHSSRGNGPWEVTTAAERTRAVEFSSENHDPRKRRRCAGSLFFTPPFPPSLEASADSRKTQRQSGPSSSRVQAPTP
ncbi:unnamed protein product, partial [Ixodes pacificus]